eukprot:6196971-Pleurochrysis_carterae.AAC.2
MDGREPRGLRGGGWHGVVARVRFACPPVAVPADAGSPRRAASGEQVTFAQCALGTQVCKFTTVALAAAASPFVTAFRAARCTHGVAGHAAVAHVRSANGAARAAEAAAYPEGMDEALADALLGAAAAAAVAGRAWRALFKFVRAAVDEARLRPPSFASFRNSETAPAAAVVAEAFPGDLRDTQPGGVYRPRKRRPSGGGRRLRRTDKQRTAGTGERRHCGGAGGRPDHDCH